MQFLKNLDKFILLALLSFVFSSCASTGTSLSIREDQLFEDNKDFFESEIDPESEVTYKVLITSDKYLISQTKFEDTLIREVDDEGDKFICDKLKELDKINEKRDATISLNLFPDTGKLKKIRPKSLTYLMEIDNLIVEDVKRWDLKFPEGTVGPNIINIKYRVILRKKLSDEEIMKEVREKVREEQEKKARLQKNI